MNSPKTKTELSSVTAEGIIRSEGRDATYFQLEPTFISVEERSFLLRGVHLPGQPSVTISA